MPICHRRTNRQTPIWIGKPRWAPMSIGVYRFRSVNTDVSRCEPIQWADVSRFNTDWSVFTDPHLCTCSTCSTCPTWSMYGVWNEQMKARQWYYYAKHTTTLRCSPHQLLPLPLHSSLPLHYRVQGLHSWGHVSAASLLFSIPGSTSTSVCKSLDKFAIGKQCIQVNRQPILHLCTWSTCLPIRFYFWNGLKFKSTVNLSHTSARPLHMHHVHHVHHVEHVVLEQKIRL